MKNKIGNIWKEDLDVVCITTNGDIGKKGLIMGKGIALEALQRFPGIERILADHVIRFGNVPCLYRNYPLIKEMHIISIPTKHHWHNHSDIMLIDNSIKMLVGIANAHPNFRKIGLPRPGCGNGGLPWELVVKPLIEPLLDDRFIIFSKEEYHD